MNVFFRHRAQLEPASAACLLASTGLQRWIRLPTLHDGGIPRGGFCNYTDGYGWQGWVYKTARRLTDAERHELEREYERSRAKIAKLREKSHEHARRRALRRWENAGRASNRHPYLTSKQVISHGLRQDGDLLLVPMWNEVGELQSLQTIDRDGKKLFLRGGRTGGCFHEICGRDDDGHCIIICEGYATGASIHEATGYAVIVSFTAGNLKAIAKLMREAAPEARIVVAADDDWKSDHNPGITSAVAAASEVGGLVAIPKFGDDRADDDTDFNDMMRAAGTEAVKQDIDAARVPTPDNGHSGNEATTKKRGKQADVLIAIAVDETDPFHSPDGIGYADVLVNDHRETWPIKSKGFRRWLARRYYEETESAPNSEAMSSALNVIEALAQYDGPTREVYMRVTQVGGKIYLDLADDDWQVIEIDSNDWRVANDPPVRFRRRPGMLALPMPVRGGKVYDLRPYVNVSTDLDFCLVISFLLSALRGRGPYPMLALLGEAGVAKSTLLRIVKALVDPNKADLRSPPRENRDLFIAANNSYVIAFDNLSALPDWLSDTLCRLATGGGFATRELYTDEEEKLFDAMRPVSLNAIENVVVRGDLADRSIFLMLATIPDDRRRPEEEFWAAFESDRPGILGALLDVIVHGLRVLPHTTLPGYPRMADFAKWGTACEGALWQPGTFARAYGANRAKATADVIEADLIADAIASLIQNKGNWKGETGPLLTLLNSHVSEDKRNDKHWPKAGNALSGKLTRAASSLRKIGIEIKPDRDPKTNRRIWVIGKAQITDEKDPSDPPNPLNRGNSKGLASKDPYKDVARPADDPLDRPLGANPLKNTTFEGSKDPKDHLPRDFAKGNSSTNWTVRPANRSLGG